MPAYPVVLFDLDHTLFDFEASKEAAFEQVLLAQGYEDPDGRYLDALGRVGQPLWAKLEAGELTLETLNDTRFEGLVATTDIEADPATMAAAFLDGLGSCGDLFPGARELLESVAEHCTVAMVSNGYSSVQRARIENFDMHDYFDVVVISDEIGVAKPNVHFFDHALELLGLPDKASTLMVGDSLSSDIEGAHRAELPACWYNPHGTPLPSDGRIAHVVSDLAEIAPIVLG